MKRLYYDLHLHSCLSPCGDEGMTPNNIVNMSLLKGLDLIALSDHNTARNVAAVAAVAAETSLRFLPGIEVTSCEEVHLLCLFEQVADCVAFGEIIYEALPNIVNKPQIFGEQQISDAQDRPIGTLPKLLINATCLTIDQVIALACEHHGVILPAHVDKSSHSILAALGTIPAEYGFGCIEVKRPPFRGDFAGRQIYNSDAHYLQHIAEPVHFLELPDDAPATVLSWLRGDA